VLGVGRGQATRRSLKGARTSVPDLQKASPCGSLRMGSLSPVSEACRRGSATPRQPPAPPRRARVSRKRPRSCRGRAALPRPRAAAGRGARTAQRAQRSREEQQRPPSVNRVTQAPVPQHACSVNRATRVPVLGSMNKRLRRRAGARRSAPHLVDGQAVRLERQAVGGHAVAGVQQQHVADDHGLVDDQALMPAAHRLNLHHAGLRVERVELAILQPVVAGGCARARAGALCAGSMLSAGSAPALWRHGPALPFASFRVCACHVGASRLPRQPHYQPRMQLVLVLLAGARTAAPVPHSAAERSALPARARRHAQHAWRARTDQAHDQHRDPDRDALCPRLLLALRRHGRADDGGHLRAGAALATVRPLACRQAMQSNACIPPAPY
jgi:hypothetical protein